MDKSIKFQLFTLILWALLWSISLQASDKKRLYPNHQIFVSFELEVNQDILKKMAKNIRKESGKGTPKAPTQMNLDFPEVFTTFVSGTSPSLQEFFANYHWHTEFGYRQSGLLYEFKPKAPFRSIEEMSEHLQKFSQWMEMDLLGGPLKGEMGWGSLHIHMSFGLDGQETRQSSGKFIKEIESDPMLHKSDRTWMLFNYYILLRRLTIENYEFVQQIEYAFDVHRTDNHSKGYFRKGDLNSENHAELRRHYSELLEEFYDLEDFLTSTDKEATKTLEAKITSLVTPQLIKNWLSLDPSLYNSKPFIHFLSFYIDFAPKASQLAVSNTLLNHFKNQEGLGQIAEELLKYDNPKIEEEYLRHIENDDDSFNRLSKALQRKSIPNTECATAINQ